MTAVLLILPVVLFAAYLIARSVNRRGWAATFDLVFGEPPVVDEHWHAFDTTMRRIGDAANHKENAR